MAEKRSLSPYTEMLTRGFDPSLSVGSARPAVFRSSTYVFPSPEAAERAFDIMAGRATAQPGEEVPLVYSRFNHPNAEILEDQIVPLERGAKCALAFNSGMAAIMTSMLAYLRPGHSVVYTIPIYGGTQHFIQDYLSVWGVHGVPVSAGHSEDLDEAIELAPDLCLVLIETPANPTLTMTDIRRAAVSAKKRAGAAGLPHPLVMVDNTLMGPAFQHPLELGADLVLYSATKYLSGLSDMIGGIVLARDKGIIQPIRSKRNLFGNILQPDECWMLDGRLTTVALRMNRQSKNAQRIAGELASHRNVERVIYPSLFEDDEQTRIYKSQCDYPGAMFSIELRGGKAGAFEFLRHLTVAKNAVSLGGIETLVCHPKTTTHSGFTEEEFEQAGVTDGLVRISVGIEDWRDLLGDFEQAADAVDAVLESALVPALSHR
jgi:cystathionine beta-lyase/cystathionine gamma-synthase